MATAATTTTTTGVAPAKKPSGQRKPIPAPNSDFYELNDVLTAAELALVKKVRTYMETKVAPIINKYWADDAFPFELLPSFKELGIGGLGFEGYGCAGGSQKLFGFVAMDLARVDASIGIADPPLPAVEDPTVAIAPGGRRVPDGAAGSNALPLLEATHKGMETNQDQGLRLEASYFGLCAATEDKKEGTTAFREKRAPQFHGR
jgi:enoyl-CoA hydratase/carnithine racemase